MRRADGVLNLALVGLRVLGSRNIRRTHCTRLRRRERRVQALEPPKESMLLVTSPGTLPRPASFYWIPHKARKAQIPVMWREGRPEAAIWQQVHCAVPSCGVPASSRLRLRAHSPARPSSRSFPSSEDSI